MTAAELFLISWFGLCALIPGVVVVIMNFDRIAVFALGEIDTPLFREAWAIAELICLHPEQWEVELYELKHPKIGQIKHLSGASDLRISGPFGDWRPNFIERRIIWNAIAWRRRASLRQAIKAHIR